MNVLKVEKKTIMSFKYNTTKLKLGNIHDLSNKKYVTLCFSWVNYFSPSRMALKYFLLYNCAPFLFQKFA